MIFDLKYVISKGTNNVGTKETDQRWMLEKHLQV